MVIVDPTGTVLHQSGEGGTLIVVKDVESIPGYLVYVSPDGLCGGHTPCYSRIQDAIACAYSSFTILAAQGAYNEDPLLDRSKQVCIKGGWDTTFTVQFPQATVIKAPRVTDGSLTLQNLIVTP